MEEGDPKSVGDLKSESPMEIILLHDHAKTTQYFKLLIDRMLDLGLEFENIP